MTDHTPIADGPWQTNWGCPPRRVSKLYVENSEPRRTLTRVSAEDLWYWNNQPETDARPWADATSSVDVLLVGALGHGGVEARE